MNEYIRITEWPTEYAQSAYNKGYFIEAIQVLHAWLETKAREVLMLLGSTRFSTELSDTWDSADEMAFKDVVRCLMICGQITKSQADELNAINCARNKIVHQIFKEPYAKEHPGYSKRDYDKVFHDALRWSNLLQSKTEELIEDAEQGGGPLR